MHFLASVFTGLALTTGSFLGLFHDGHPSTSTPPMEDHKPFATSTLPHDGDRFSTSTVSELHLHSGQVATSTIICVGSAVATREASLDAAEINLTSALNSAYSTRASALASAYALTTGSDVVRAAVKVAWKAFSSSTQSARKSWNSARMTSWQAFTAAARACKAPSSMLDTANSSLETSGY